MGIKERRELRKLVRKVAKKCDNADDMERYFKRHKLSRQASQNIADRVTFEEMEPVPDEKHTPTLKKTA